MDFAVSKRDAVGLFVVEVFKAHSNHCRFFLFYINELNKAFLTACLEIPANSVVRNHSSVQVAFFVEHHLDVPFSDLESVVLNDVQRALHSTSVGEKPDFTSLEIPDD
jgi:hypothetical protein